jgi:hypothetical protein
LTAAQPVYNTVLGLQGYTVNPRTGSQVIDSQTGALVALQISPGAGSTYTGTTAVRRSGSTAPLTVLPATGSQILDAGTGELLALQKTPGFGSSYTGTMAVTRSESLASTLAAESGLSLADAFQRVRDFKADTGVYPDFSGSTYKVGGAGSDGIASGATLAGMFDPKLLLIGAAILVAVVVLPKLMKGGKRAARA